SGARHRGAVAVDRGNDRGGAADDCGREHLAVQRSVRADAQRRFRADAAARGGTGSKRGNRGAVRRDRDHERRYPGAWLRDGGRGRASRMKIPFTKAHGARNDFLLTWTKDAPADDRTALARAICDRYTSVGADGWLLVGPADGECDGSIELYNSD